MSIHTDSMMTADRKVQKSWLPMVVITMAQMLISFNVAALPVSIIGMVNSFNSQRRPADKDRTVR